MKMRNKREQDFDGVRIIDVVFAGGVCILQLVLGNRIVVSYLTVPMKVLALTILYLLSRGAIVWCFRDNRSTNRSTESFRTKIKDLKHLRKKEQSRQKNEDNNHDNFRKNAIPVDFEILSEVAV